MVSSDGNYSFYAYTIDNAGNTNTTETRNLTVSVPPQYFNNATNATVAGQPTLFSVNWTDTSLSGYVFSTNNSGTWANDSFTYFGEVNNNSLDMTTGLVGLWHMNEGSGNTSDISGNNNNGTLYNGTQVCWGNSTYNTTCPQWTVGKFGNGLNFDGVNDYVNVSLNSNSSSFSIGGWFKLTNTTITQGIMDLTHDGSQYFRITNYPTDGSLQVEVHNTTGSLFYVSPPSGTITSNRWYHVIAVVDIPTQKLRLYINGTESSASPRTLNESASTWNATIFRIGTDSRYTNGTIDDVAIWNRSLSAAEIASLYALGQNATQSWSNVTKTLNGTIGTSVGWKVYANDTANNWNTSSSELNTTGVNGCQVYVTWSSNSTYTMSQNNTYYCLNQNWEIDGVTAINTTNNLQNSTLDCLGYNINSNLTTGTYGIFLNSSSVKNNTIKNCNITKFDKGIRLSSSSNNTITNNTASGNSNVGIHLQSSSNNNTLSNNNASSNTGGIGIFLQSSSNFNTLTNNTANSNIDGILIQSSSNNNTVINNTVNSNYYGIYITISSSNNSITNNTVNSNTNGFRFDSSSSNTLVNNSISASHTSSSKQQGLRVDGTVLADFKNNIGETNTINGLPVYYIDGQVRPCVNNTVYTNGSSYGYMGFVGCSNITVSNSAPTDHLLLAATTNSTISNLNISFSGSAISLQASSNFNNLTNNTLNNNLVYGLNIGTGSNNNTITNNNASSNSNIGIYVDGSNNTLTNNTANGNYYDGIYLFTSASNNILINNTFNSNTWQGGIHSHYGSGTIITGGSIAMNAVDYYLSAAGGTPSNFTNTNFTAQRKIYLGEVSLWFNYANDTSGLWLKTTVSVASTLTRTLNNWSQSNMSWSDNVTSGTATANYTLTGLIPSTPYSVYNFSTLAYSLTTDANGALNFTIDLNTTSRQIMVNGTDVTSPQYSSNATNTTLAGTPTLFSVNWTDNVGLSGYVFSTNNTGTWVNDSFNAFSTTFGDKNIESPGLGENNGYIDLARFQAPVNGTVTRLTLYCGIYAATPRIKPVVYSENSSGYPSMLLGVGDELIVPPSSQWTNLTGLNISVVAGQYYWIGIAVGDESGDGVSMGGTWQTSPGFTIAAVEGSYSNPPNPIIAGPGNLYADTTISIYAVITTPPIQAWSNVTKILNSTVGSNVQWRVYANDTSNNWNTSTSELITIGTRYLNFTQGVTGSQALSRLSLFFSRASSFLSVSNLISRISTMVRGILQSVSVNHLASRTLVAFRSASDYLSSSDLISKLSSLFRSVADSFSLVQNVTKLRRVLASAASGFTLGDSISNLGTYFRSAVTSLSGGQSTSNILRSVRAFLQSFSGMGNISRMTSAYRYAFSTTILLQSASRFFAFYGSVLQSFNIDGIINAFSINGRIASVSMSVSDAVEKMSSFWRSLFQPSQASAAVSAAARYARGAVSGFSLANSASETMRNGRLVFQGLITQSYVKNVQSLTRSFAQWIGLNGIARPSALMGRILSSSFSLSGIAPRVKVFSALVTQSLDISAIFGRLTNLTLFFGQGISSNQSSYIPFPGADYCRWFSNPTYCDSIFMFGCRWCDSACHRSIDCALQQPASPGPTGGGGGFPQFQTNESLSLATNVLEVRLYPGEYQMISLGITNNKKTNVEMSLGIEGDIWPFALFESDKVTVDAGTTGYVRVKFFTMPTTIPGVYTGTITIKSTDGTQKVSVILRVESEKEKLLDVKVDTVTKDVPPGEKLKYQVTLYNLGLTKRVDVFLNYTVRPAEGSNIVMASQETMALETSLSFIREMTVPNDTQPGLYTIEAFAWYENKTASSVASFNVCQPDLDFTGCRWEQSSP